MLPRSLAFVDIETTGTSILRDRIIEIGILRVEEGKLVSTFNSLINPQTHVTPYIENMTGISSLELRKEESFIVYKWCLLGSYRFDAEFIDKKCQ